MIVDAVICVPAHKQFTSGVVFVLTVHRSAGKAGGYQMSVSPEVQVQGVSILLPMQQQHSPTLCHVQSRHFWRTCACCRALRSQQFLAFTAADLAARESKQKAILAQLEASRRGKVVSRAELDNFYTRLQVLA